MMKFKRYGLGVSFVCLIFITCLALGSSETSKDENIGDGKLPVQDVQRFTSALSYIKQYYVEPAKDQKLFEDAIRGMVAGLDPHSSYLDEEEYKDLKAATKGEFSGLGLEVTLESGLIKVISPIDNTPAQIAGVLAGDVIVRIDETSVKDMTLSQAVKKMRGEKGSPITLTIVRQGQNQPLVLKLVRNVIHVVSVKSELLEDNYGYVRITQFQAQTAKNLIEALKNIDKKVPGGKGIKGLILDLRNNPGGLLDSAIDVADAFLDSRKLGKNKLIVYTKGRIPGSDFEATADTVDFINGKPVVILINQGSASGAEIVAGALQDHKRAILVGTDSFGKGSVQTVFPLDNNTGIKLTTALYFTPLGRSIQAEGIHPDVRVEDFKLADAGKYEQALNYLKEVDLEKHLANGNGRIDSKKSAAVLTQEGKDVSLARKDYQLYEALNMLKGMIAIGAK
ncbi:S41 family peptidase [soil metagenome]